MIEGELYPDFELLIMHSTQTQESASSTACDKCFIDEDASLLLAV